MASAAPRWQQSSGQVTPGALSTACVSRPRGHEGTQSRSRGSSQAVGLCCCPSCCSPRCGLGSAHGALGGVEGGAVRGCPGLETSWGLGDAPALRLHGGEEGAAGMVCQAAGCGSFLVPSRGPCGAKRRRDVGSRHVSIHGAGLHSTLHCPQGLPSHRPAVPPGTKRGKGKGTGRLPSGIPHPWSTNRAGTGERGKLHSQALAGAAALPPLGARQGEETRGANGGSPHKCQLCHAAQPRTHGHAAQEGPAERSRGAWAMHRLHCCGHTAMSSRKLEPGCPSGRAPSGKDLGCIPAPWQLGGAGVRCSASWSSWH